MEAIQEVLFENKQDIPDGVYLKLMNLLKPEATQFYELEYSVLAPSVGWDKQEKHYEVSITMSHMKYNSGGFGKMIVRLDKLTQHHTKESIKALTPFIAQGWELKQVAGAVSSVVRQSAYISENHDTDDSEDDDENDGDEKRRVHINNTFVCTSLLWIAKITRL